MTTITAFSEMMGQFIEELHETFPDEQAVQKVRDELKTARPRDTFDAFMKDIAPWVNQMLGKNPEFFCKENVFVSKLNLHEVWKREDCSENTKAAIWQYFQTLYMLGTTINMFPPETLSMIEAAAETAAKNMKNSNQPPTEAALMAGVNNMLSQMLSSGMMPVPQPVPKPKRKVKKISK
jgi:hypothetical protein